MTDPTTPPPEQTTEELLALATRAAQARNLEQASTLLDTILARDPASVRALDLLGFVRFFQRRFPEAEDACRRALARQPDHAYAHKGLGLNLAAQGKLDEGVAELEEAIRLKPNWFDPYWDLSVTLHDHGRTADALAVLARAQVAVPNRRADFVRLAQQIGRKQEGGRRSEG